MIIDEQGQHATLGSYAPAPSEVDTLVATYTGAGIGAWIVEMTGVYYSRGKLTLRHVAGLGPANTAYENAVLAFNGLRKERTR
jgi:hypothetical protein